MERTDIELVNSKSDISNQLIETSSHDTIAHHAKSFYWASKFLKPDVFKDVSFLYLFCRWVDDTADELAPDSAKTALLEMKSQILGLQPAKGLLLPFLQMCIDKGVERDWVIELIKGAEGDLIKVRFQDEKELLVYSYRVAGVVGLMMCPLIGVKEPTAHYHAIDLGLAMQLTNIARDVYEDALIDRVYLPQRWLTRVGLTSEHVISITKTGNVSQRDVLGIQLKPVIKELLDLSDLYTDSGLLGLKYIPVRERLSILVAARIYQAIGTKIRDNDYFVMGGRTRVSSLKKAWITVKCLVEFFNPKHWLKGEPSLHDSSLHWGLVGLPATHQNLDH